MRSKTNKRWSWRIVFFPYFLLLMKVGFCQVAPVVVVHNEERDIASFARFTPDGRNIITIQGGDLHSNGKVAIWNAETGRLINQYELPGYYPVSVSVSQDGSYAAIGCEATTAIIVNLNSGGIDTIVREEYQPIGGNPPQSCVAWCSMDPSLFITFYAGIHGKAWNAFSGKSFDKFEILDGQYHVRFYPDKDRFIANDTIYSLREKKVLFKVEGQATLLDDNQTILSVIPYAGSDGRFEVKRFMKWSAGTGELIHQFNVFESSDTTFVIHPSGVYYISYTPAVNPDLAGSPSVKIRMLETHEDALILTKDGSEKVKGRYVSLSGDGMKAAIVNGKDLYIYNLSSLFTSVPNTFKY